MATTEFIDAAAVQSKALGTDPAYVFVPHPVQDRTDDELLAARLVVAADVTEERSHWPGEADPTVLVLCQGGGAELLDLDVDELRRATVAEVRELLVEGMLLVASGG